MSEEKKGSSTPKKDAKTYYFAAGVFKFDHMAAGFPDLRKIAQDWAEEDEHFVQLIIRGVSETNYGIDFAYYREFEEGEEAVNVMKIKRDELIERFGRENGFYAWDYHTSKDSVSNWKIKQSVVKQTELNLD